MPEVLVNANTVAEILNLTRRRVSQLVAEQVLPAPVNHRYDALKCAMRYIKYQRRNAEQQGGGSSTADLKKSRADLLRSQKKNADLAYRKQVGELIDIEDLQAVVNEGTAILVGQKRSMSSRLAGQLAGMSDPVAILKLLNSENDKILLELSKKLSALADRATRRVQLNLVTTRRCDPVILPIDISIEYQAVEVLHDLEGGLGADDHKSGTQASYIG
jgi:phage terminase Nu1 subunit (DNA packaging protein)